MGVAEMTAWQLVKDGIAAIRPNATELESERILFAAEAMTLLARARPD